MRLTLLGFTVPDAIAVPLLTGDRSPQVQTLAFARALLEALRSAGVETSLLSTAPVSSFPHNPRVLFGSRRFVDAAGPGQLLGFVNLLGLRHLTRLSHCLTRGRSRLREWQPDVLLVHGVHSPFLWFGVWQARTRGLRVVVVLTDPPGGGAGAESRLTRALRRADRWLVRAALQRVSGVVALTAALASDFAPGVPSLVMEGICSDAPLPPAARPDAERSPLLVYAGGVTRSYGVERLARAVLARPDGVRLQVYGRGELVGWLTDLAATDRRILPPRFVPRDEVAKGYAVADALVQPRPADQDFVPYSFPSKLIEYLASGVPVLSTRLPGIPADYTPYAGWIEPDTEAGINAAVDRLLAVPADERCRRGREAAEFVGRTRSASAQGARLAFFLRGLVETEG